MIPLRSNCKSLLSIAIVSQPHLVSLRRCPHPKSADPATTIVPLNAVAYTARLIARQAGPTLSFTDQAMPSFKNNMGNKKDDKIRWGEDDVHKNFIHLCGEWEG